MMNTLNWNWVRSLILGLVLAFCGSAEGQTSQQTWMLVHLKGKVNEKLTAHLRPIIRLNKWWRDIDDVSPDFGISYALPKNFSAGVWWRYFIIREARPRYFLFFDLNHNAPDLWGVLGVKSRLRYHYGLDVNGREDIDFLRPFVKISPITGHRLRPFLNLEPFLRVGEAGSGWQYRIEGGVDFALDKRTNYSAMYRYQTTENRAPKRTFHMFVFNFSHALSL